MHCPIAVEKWVMRKHSTPNIPLRRCVADVVARGQSLTDRFDEADIVASLREEGITTIEQLVSRAAARQRDGRPQNSIRVGVEATEPGLPLQHSTPHFPVAVDGVVYDPNDLSRFDGSALHFLLLHDESGPLLQATTDAKKIAAIKAVDVLVRPRDFVPDRPEEGLPGGRHKDPRQDHYEPPPPPQPPVTGSSIQMFSDIDWEGDWCWLDKGFQISRLSKVSRNTVLMFSGDWNDHISSLSATDGFVTYFEHANFQGSSITIEPYHPKNHLLDIGWNDRISSVRY